MPVTARWRRPPPDPGHQPVVAYPPPPRPDPGPRARPRSAGAYPGGQPAKEVPYTLPATVSAAAARTAPPAWQPAPAVPPEMRPTARPGPRAVIWSLPKPPVPPAPAIPAGRFQITTAPAPGCGGDGINYDPPPEAGGTGLQQTLPDGSWVVHPLSVIHPGSQVGDEGPVNEAFLSTPVVHLCAGRPYALSSALVVPNGATLYLNRAALDRTMIQAGEGAVIYD